MKTLIAAILVAWACLAQNLAKAQSNTGSISGVVIDKNKAPVDVATITLISAKDSSVVKSVLANVDGTFVFGALTPAEYKIVITAMGFANYRSAIINVNSQLVKLPVIILVQTTKTLKEVAVTEQKAFVEQKIDRTVVNVNALISNTGANALEALEKAPGVTIDDNGTITFKGKTGVMVMIDDKPTYLSGENLANYLKSIPASQLDKIELMPNPPAKYDASGNAGVINIKIKKSKERGFNGSFAGSVGNAAYWRTLESLNLNYHVDKVNLFANVSYGIGNNYRRLDVTRTYLEASGNIKSGYTELAFFHPINYNRNLRAGMDYSVTPKTTIGFVFTGLLTTGNNVSPVYSKMTDNAGRIDSNIVANNITNSRFQNAGVNLNYSHQYNTSGQVLSLDLDYLNYTSRRDQSFYNSTYNSAGVLGSTQNITDNLPAEIYIYTAKTDYAQPLKNKGTFETGLKTSYVNTDNSANYFNVVNNISTVDNNNTNRFVYKENINAAYVNYNQSFARFSVQAGLRLENTNVQGHQLGNALSADSTFTQHYTNLFPTTYLLYKLDTAGKNTLKVSFGRRIDRPYYQDLNPFVTILDKYSQFGGNPFLKPQIASEYQLTYGYKSVFSFTIDHNIINNYIVEVDEQRGDIFFATDRNLGKRSHWGFETYLALAPYKWWNFNINAELDYNRFEGQVNGLMINQPTTYLYFNGISQFNLSNGWNAELNVFYLSPSRDSQFTHIYRLQINPGISKKVLHDKGTLKLSARDITRSNFSGGNITNIPNVIATYYNDNANRSITLGFTYNFGSTPKNQTKRKTGGAGSEQDRAGN